MCSMRIDLTVKLSFVEKCIYRAEQQSGSVFVDGGTVLKCVGEFHSGRCLSGTPPTSP